MSGWIRCPECGARMKHNTSNHQYYCKKCDEWYNEDELESGDVYIDRDSNVPAVCQACGGPYPACSIGCDLLDDD